MPQQQVTGFKGLHVFCLCLKIPRNYFAQNFLVWEDLKSKWSDHSAFSRHSWCWHEDTAPVGFLQSACCWGPLGQQGVQLQVSREATTALAFSQLMIWYTLALNWEIFWYKLHHSYLFYVTLRILIQSILSSYSSWIFQSTSECNYVWAWDWVDSCLPVSTGRIYSVPVWSHNFFHFLVRKQAGEFLLANFRLNPPMQNILGWRDWVALGRITVLS